ncbi:hypothetical protein [Streptomyces aureoversilis]|uniref:Uncharacterized protein n=1 Tax=Streptomyces aureoversilis TaxID=67277 RepID=A0ABV9ZT73_9ACTN
MTCYPPSQYPRENWSRFSLRKIFAVFFCRQVRARFDEAPSASTAQPLVLRLARNVGIMRLKYEADGNEAQTLVFLDLISDCLLKLAEAMAGCPAARPRPPKRHCWPP